jgi:hypothetical protein
MMHVFLATVNADRAATSPGPVRLDTLIEDIP